MNLHNVARTRGEIDAHPAILIRRQLLCDAVDKSEPKDKSPKSGARFVLWVLLAAIVAAAAVAYLAFTL